MNRTKNLFGILITLIFVFSLYLLFSNYNGVLDNIKALIKDIRGNEVIIPSETYYAKNYKFETVNVTKNFEPTNIDDIKDIYYTVLNNGWESFTFYCDDEIYPTCIDDVKSVANDDEYLSIINNYVSPYNSYKKYNTLVIGNDEIYLTVEKLYSDEEIREVEGKISSIIHRMNVNVTNVTVDDIKNIHNHLIKNITYDDNFDEENTTSISNKASGALNNGIALCSGYTDTFALILDKLNIPNFKVSSENHIWNLIYFDNKWSHVDLTWDDDEINESNTYNFFMIDTAKLKKLDSSEHTFNESLYLEIK